MAVAMATVMAVTALAADYSVRLRASDNNGEPEIYATCRLYAAADTLHAFKAGLTDSLGVFSAQLPAAGRYILSLEAAGTSKAMRKSFTVSDDEPQANLGDVIVGGMEESLHEVTVTAQRPLVQKKIDRIGYDVQADPDSRTVTLQDMMRRVPLVAVDADGNITVRGSSNFKIYRNGKPSTSLTNNAKEILAAIPASMIKSIEVITEPGARYDAEGIGAILNIITVDNSTINGVTGTASLRADTRTLIPNPNLYVTSQIDKVTFSVYGGMHVNSGHRNKSTTASEFLYADGRRMTSTGTSTENGLFSWFGGEASWDINKNNMLAAEFNGYYYTSKPRNNVSTNTLTAADGSTISSYTATAQPLRSHNTDFSGTLSYEHTTSRAGEALTASYLVSSTAGRARSGQVYSDIVGNLFPYTADYTNSRTNFIEHTLQLDWKRPFAGIHTLETGAKYILRRNRSEANHQYEGWEDTHTDFRHLTDIGAVYAQYTAAIRNVTLRGGLRYELSRLKAEYPDGSQQPFSKTLSDLVPSASLMWQINQVHSLTANYAARINRPGISYLNPERSYTPTTLSYGNPDLSSAFSNSLKLQYAFMKMKLMFNVSASYSFNNDNIAGVQFVDPDGLRVSTYDNIGHERVLSLGGFVQWRATAKTAVMANVNVDRTSYRQNGMRLAKWGPQIFMRVSQDLPWKLSVQGMFFFMGTRVNDVYSYMEAKPYERAGCMLNLRRSFLKEDRLTVSVGVTNPIGRNNRTFRTYTVNGDFTGQNAFTLHNIRMANVSISYRFGSLKASVKKTSANLGNDDLMGRGSSREQGSTATQSTTGM